MFHEAIIHGIGGQHISDEGATVMAEAVKKNAHLSALYLGTYFVLSIG